MYRVHSGKESTSGWRANWLYIVTIQYYAFKSRFIHVWWVDLWAMKPNIAPSQIVQRLSAKHVGERPITWSKNNENDENRRARIRKCLDCILQPSSFAPCFRSEMSASEFRFPQFNINSRSLRPDPPSKGMPVNFAGRPHNRNLLPDQTLCT